MAPGRWRGEDRAAEQAARPVPPPARANVGPGNAALARLADTAGGGPVSADVAAGIASARGGGAALPAAVRDDMEAAFGADLSAVRLHRGADAAGLNRSVAAEAFTSGTDIFLSAADLDATGGHGREVIAHELTHVVQHATGRGGPAGTVSRPTDAAEVEARRMAAAVVSGSSPNSAVARALRPSAGTAEHSATGPARLPSIGGGPPTVRRWAADEHLELGDTTGLTIDIGDGVQLTFGQVVALAGDEFGTYEELVAATRTPDGRAMIRAHLERAALPAAVGPLPAPTQAQEAQANTEYVMLAMENTAHFSAGGTAVETWADHHALAIDKALAAGLWNDDGLLNEARFAEAFGAHFLTDAFSAGHVRVPREDIADYYVHTVAPSVFDHLVDYLRRFLVEELSEQIEPQSGAAGFIRGAGGPFYGRGYASGLISGRVNTAVVDRLNEAIAKAGGRDEAVRYLGLGLAGLVCGALHDADNRDGLMVISAAHPDPWQAFGDGLLERNEEHQRRAEEAVAASVADLTTAYEIGQGERLAMDMVPDLATIPTTVYFEFNKADAVPDTRSAAELLSHFLRYEPATVVSLVGHTDPIGSEEDNVDLGLRRAQTVESILTADGVDQSRVRTATRGKLDLITTVAAEYHRNRRVEIGLATDAALAAAPEPAEDAAERHAALLARNRIGPPYEAERHVPQESPGVYAALPEWEWHQISGPLEAEVNKWVLGYLHEYRDRILAAEELNDDEVEGFTIRPRPIVMLLLARIERDPMAFLREALGG